MTAAIAITALVLTAGLTAALVWAVRWGRDESRMAVASALKAMEADRRADTAVAERDAAVVAAAQSHDAHVDVDRRLADLTRLYYAALEELNEATASQLAGAAPGDAPRIVAGMLARRLARQTGATAPAAGGRGPADAPDVRAGGTAAEPAPAADDGGR